MHRVAGKYSAAQARGQALHQDQYYLRAQPGTCLAAWMALDGCDEANGCMRVVPGSHTWPLLCSAKADFESQSFSDVTVDIPPSAKAEPVVMEPGRVMFSGSLVHGSHPNTTTDRFRRALIGHYIEASEKVVEFYHPALRVDAFEVELGNSEAAVRARGVWKDKNGVEVSEMVARRRNGCFTNNPAHQNDPGVSRPYGVRWG